MDTRTCPHCNGSLIRGNSRGIFIGRRSDGMSGQTETVKYLCQDCGYVEERAVNTRYLSKEQ